MVSIAGTSYSSNSRTVILISVATVASIVFFTLSFCWFFRKKITFLKTFNKTKYISISIDQTEMDIMCGVDGKRVISE